MQLPIKIHKCSILLVILAASALNASGAAATSGGHFTSTASHTSISVTEATGGQHAMAFSVLGTTITCHTSTHSGTSSALTTTQITVEASYNSCTAGEDAATVTMNGCDYLLTIRPSNVDSSDSTVHLKCPIGAKAEIHTTNGTFKFSEQTPTIGGISYSTITENGKHAITANVTVEGIHYECHGLCAIFGTSQTGAVLSGALKVHGKDKSGNAVDITATGMSRIHSEVSHTNVTGSQVAANAFTFGVLLGKVQCEVATVDGTLATATAAELTVKPAYSKCSGSEREVTVHMNGCAYVLVPTAATDGTTAVECPTGKAIEMTVDAFPGGCTITIGAQTAGGVSDYKNEGAGTSRDVLVTWTLEGIDYTRDGCEVGGTGNNGTLTGSLTLKGEDTSGVQKGIWIE